MSQWPTEMGEDIMPIEVAVAVGMYMYMGMLPLAGEQASNVGADTKQPTPPPIGIMQQVAACSGVVAGETINNTTVDPRLPASPVYLYLYWPTNLHDSRNLNPILITVTGAYSFSPK